MTAPAYRIRTANESAFSDLSEQFPYDAEPFCIEWFSANGFPCSTIPVKCVALIAFLRYAADS